MEEIMQVANILYTNAENVQKILAIVAAIGSMLVATWRILIFVIPFYLSSNIEIALMSKQEQWKYSCLNIMVLSISIWIMNLGIGWLSWTENIKKVCMLVLFFSLVELTLLSIMSVGKWLYGKIRECHIGRFGIVLMKALFGKIGRNRDHKRKKPLKEKKNKWIYEKWIETANDKKHCDYNFYTWLLLGLFLFDIAMSGAITYDRGVKQRLWVSAMLTGITIEIIVGMIIMKKQTKKASIIFFSPENNKNIYIYLKNNQGKFICGNSKIMEECTEYYVIPQEHILDKKLKLTSKDYN